MEELLFLNGLLLSRLVFIFNDVRLPGKTLTLVLSAQAVLCFLLFGLGWPAVLLAVLVLLVHWVAERWLRATWLNEGRLLGLLVILAATAALREPLTPAHWSNAALTELVSLFASAGAAIDDVLKPTLWFLLGFLLVANEANLLIRILFRRFNLEPRIHTGQDENTSNAQLDEQEYNAGRVIGILERCLMYSVLLLSQNFNVIALIIAAKGFARFRQMEERAFAEYVLIGTLCSILLTVLVAQLTGSLSGTWSG
jgi:hypothetical protein